MFHLGELGSTQNGEDLDHGYGGDYSSSGRGGHVDRHVHKVSASKCRRFRTGTVSSLQLVAAAACFLHVQGVLIVKQVIDKFCRFWDGYWQ
ncbi:hypothetical protein V6N13_140940 [Hibiscus sabdariffa]